MEKIDVMLIMILQELSCQISSCYTTSRFGGPPLLQLKSSWASPSTLRCHVFLINLSSFPIFCVSPFLIITALPIWGFCRSVSLEIFNFPTNSMNCHFFQTMWRLLIRGTERFSLQWTLLITYKTQLHAHSLIHLLLLKDSAKFRNNGKLSRRRLAYNRRENNNVWNSGPSQVRNYFHLSSEAYPWESGV